MWVLGALMIGVHSTGYLVKQMRVPGALIIEVHSTRGYHGVLMLVELVALLVDAVITVTVTTALVVAQ